MPFSVRGDHVRGLKLAYGTAVCSRLPLYGGESHAFNAAPPMFTKGFVVTTVPWPDGSGRELDLVSVHLDFARASVRRDQVRRLAGVLASRPGPFVVMGDFNCDGSGKDDALALFLEETGLQAFEHGVDGLETFAFLGKRLDWILISPELEFVSYKVLPDVVSDHRAVASEIAWKHHPARAG
jgi:endonuclease/exonuclease/phosphatase family metal-dependent hydrolase